MKKLLFPILILLITFSCSDDSLVTPEDKNILIFKDVSDIFTYAAKSEENQSFISFDAIYKQALDKLSEAQTVEEHSRLLDIYSDVIVLSDETYTPTISNSMYRKIINRERLYISGGFVHKVLDDQSIVFADKQNINEIREITSAENLDNAFSVVKYNGSEIDLNDSNARTAADCGFNLKKDYFLNRTNCRDDRKVWVRAYASYAISGNQYTPQVISEAYGEIRTGTFCNFKSYQTRLSTRNCSYTVTIVINGITYSSPRTFADYNGTGDQFSHVIEQGPIFSPPNNAITWAGGTIPTIQFTNIHLEATSRGVDGNWAVIDCQ